MYRSRLTVYIYKCAIVIKCWNDGEWKYAGVFLCLLFFFFLSFFFFLDLEHSYLLNTSKERLIPPPFVAVLSGKGAK